MPYGRSKLYGNGDIAERGDVADATVAARAMDAIDTDAARLEIETLRSINAHLVREIADLRQREAQAQQLADRDGLTGVYNRRRVLELLDKCIPEASQQRRKMAVLFIDLDGFKGINDAFGHAMGDKLLTSVGARIAARARTGDIVGRYGGDEFVVLLPDLPDPDTARKVANTLRKRLALPYEVDGLEVHLSAAIGVSMFPDDGQTAAALLHRADELMYREKARQAGLARNPDRAAIRPPARRRDDTSKRGAGW